MAQDSIASPAEADGVGREEKKLPQQKPVKFCKNRKSRTIREKIDIINLLGAGMDRKQIQKMFGLSAEDIRNILRSKDKLLEHHRSGKDLDNRNLRRASFPTIDAEVGRWLRDMAEQAITLNGKAIRAKALQVAHDQGIHHFKASYEWVTMMKKRQLAEWSTPPPQPPLQQQQQHQQHAASNGSRSSNQCQSNYNAHSNVSSRADQLLSANDTASCIVNRNLINVNGNNACIIQGLNLQVNEPATLIFPASWFADVEKNKAGR